MNGQKRHGVVVGLILVLGALPAFAEVESVLIPRPAHSQEQRGSRIAMEALGGTLGTLGGVIGTAVILIPLAEVCEGCQSSPGLAAILLPGAWAGMSLGVWAGGTVVDGQGGLLATFGGGLLGLGAGTAIFLAAGDTKLLPIAAVMPLAGAILGYELSGDRRAAKVRRDSSIHLVPVVSVGAGGALQGGLAGRF